MGQGKDDIQVSLSPKDPPMSQAPQTRIGVMVPAGNTVHEAEFAVLRPEGVAFKFVGFGYPRGDGDFCSALADNMAGPVAELTAWGAQLILVGCTTASMTCSGEAFTDRLEAMAGVPVITAAGAAQQAIAALQLHDLAVATPYGDPANAVVQDFLERSGAAVAVLKGLDFDRSPDAWREGQAAMTPDFVRDLSLGVDTPQADGLYLPCAGMVSLDAIDSYEATTGKSAFSSVQAGYWAALRRLGVDGRRLGAGRLVETWDF